MSASALTAADRRLAERVVADGLLPAMQVQVALDELARRRQAGDAVSLGALLVARGLKPRQLASLATAGDTRTLVPADIAPAPVAAPESADASRSIWTRLANLGPAIRIRLPGDEMPGEGDGRLGPFRRVREVARGGMARVLAAEDPDIGRVVAIKVSGRASDDQGYVLHKFLLEAQVTGQLEHPNIVPLYHLGLTGEGDPYFSMKLVRGMSLEALLRQMREDDPALSHRPTRVALLRDFLKVCDAVRYAHSRGVVHRDLKPANIMVGPFGEVYVMDWGVAQVRDLDEIRRFDETTQLGINDDTAPRTLQGTILGTPHYMAPEQARGDTAAIDARADVYALGAILYQILTLERPFEGRNTVDVVNRVVAGQLIPPSQRAPGAGIQRELEAVVIKAMATEPAARYADVGLLARDVEAFLEGRLLTAARYTPIQRLGKLVQRYRAAAIVAILAGVALLVALTMREREYGTLRREHERLRERLRAVEARGLDARGLDALRKRVAARRPPRAWGRSTDPPEQTLAVGDRWHETLGWAVALGLDELEGERAAVGARRLVLCEEALRAALEAGRLEDARRWLDRAASRGLSPGRAASWRAELARRAGG